MAGCVNKVIMLGNLTRDVEVRHTAGNLTVATVSIAVNRKWKDRDGQDQTETCFIECEAWGRTAEVCKQYLVKGRPVFIEGRLKYEQWEDKNSGQKRSRHKIVIENVQFLSSGERQQKSAEEAPARSEPGETEEEVREGTHFEPIKEADIPF